MKNLFIAVALVAVSTIAAAGTNEYRLNRVIIPASDGITYDTARQNLHIDRSQVFISNNAFWMKTELSLLHYLPGEAKIFEKYLYSTSDGKKLVLTDPRGKKTTATVLRVNPLRIKFASGVTLQFKQVKYSGRDKHRDIHTLIDVKKAAEKVIANDEEFMLPSL